MTTMEASYTVKISTDVIGSKFGKLTVIEVVSSGEQGRIVKCECSCGKQTSSRLNALRSGHKKSCGCWRTEIVTVHGMYSESEYGNWSAMIRRCIYSEPGDGSNFDYYKAKGVKVCERWRSFENFMVDMGPKPSILHTLDRIEVNKDYEPGNCRWATRMEQANNRSNNVFFTIEGEKKTLKEWSRIYSVNYNTLWSRIDRGIAIEAALEIKKKSA